MNITFNGALAVVTGGTGGIGTVVVKTLLESGARVALVDLNPELLEKTAAELSPYGEVKGYALNIADTEAITETVRKIREEMGEIGVLVQTAGLLWSKDGLSITEKEWDALMNVNARGMFFMMQQTVAQSMAKNGGSIVNFSSMAGIRGMNRQMASAHYSASKGAVAAMTMQAAVEWADLGVRVNALAPGGVRTKAIEGLPAPDFGFNPIPLGQLSTPQDIANLVTFIASDWARMITGQVLVIDGGSSAVGY